MTDHHQLSNFIWQIADLLRGPYRPNQYERVMLPLTVLRRFDSVLANTKSQVIAKAKELERRKLPLNDAVLNKITGYDFHNHSEFTFTRIKDDPSKIVDHLTSYIAGFSQNVQDIFGHFGFENEIYVLNDHNILYLVVARFCEVDLHPDSVDPIQMGLLFEDLIRRFNEANNQEAGDHFTPREVISLMVETLLSPDKDKSTLTDAGKNITVFDPTCGTGGMLYQASRRLQEHNPQLNVFLFGQDFNPFSYAVAASDALLRLTQKEKLRGISRSKIMFGDTLTDDQFTDRTFDYLLANPPFGVDWKKQQRFVQEEHERLRFQGRFGAGLPRVNDGALLFLQHMIDKFVPYKEGSRDDSGSRMAIVFNGSPLFTGGAGSGESEIRRWIIEQDWLEAIIALPEQMFYNTGIGTYIWIVTNRKEAHRRGKIQLIDGRERWKPMRRSLNNKRRYLGEDDIAAIVREYGAFQDTTTCKIFHNVDFGYNRVQIDRPLRLLYTMDVERKARFLDAFPHLLDDVQAIDHELGRTPREDWHEFESLMLDLLMKRSSKWKIQERKNFRDVFTEVDDGANPVIIPSTLRKAKHLPIDRIWGWFPYKENKSDQEVRYEPDTGLRDFESVPLMEIAGVGDHVISGISHLTPRNEEKIAEHVSTQVIPYVSHAWADYDSIRPAYEINFNRYFYTYTPPRPLAEIDADIKQLEEEILRLLREVTE